MSYLGKFHTSFDAACLHYLDGKIRIAQKIHPTAGVPYQYIREFLLNGGKRFRPAMFYYAYGSTAKKAGIDPMRLSFVFELVHTFALIHDDIIDNAPLRRGVRTVHESHGIPPAILSGNMALMLADELFAEMLLASRLDERERKSINRLYDAYKQELMTGQYLDYIQISDTQLIMYLKTSLYSFVRPAAFGFLFGGSPQKAKSWEMVLANLGVLFQMKDDYEGTFGKVKNIGKSVTSDIEEGKNTHIVALFRELASSVEMKRFTGMFGKSGVSPGDFDWYLRTLKEYGIDGRVRDDIQSGITEIIQTAKKFKDSEFSRFVIEIAELVRRFSR